MNLKNKCVGLLPLLLSAAACSDMSPDSDTYNTTILGLSGGAGGDDTGIAGSSGSGGAGGTEGDPPEMALLDTAEWSCLEKDPRTLMAPRTPGSARIKYRVPIVDFDSLTPVPGLIVQACVTSNCDVYPECTTAAPTPTEPCAIVTPPAAGATYEINLPYNFTGGLKLTKPGEYAEMDYFFGGPLVGLPEEGLDDGGDVVFGLPIPVLKESSRLRAYNEVGAATVDSSRGTLAVRTLNCLRQPATPPANGMMLPPQGQRAAGVALEAIPKAPEGSLSWTLSSLNAFTPNRLVTDGRGVAGFLQAPPRIMDVQAVLADGTTYGLTSLRVRANVITLAELRPGLEVWGQ